MITSLTSHLVPGNPWLGALVAIAAALAVVTLAAIYAGLFIYFERRIGARIMSRIGPNRVGPHGLLQWVADAVKLLLKEDLIPTTADKPLFRLAPYLVAMGILSAFAVLPLSHSLIGVDLNLGLLYIVAVTSLSVVGVLMSGWASNSKWSLLGGMRAAAQLVSYEVPLGLSLLAVVLLAGSLSTQDIVRAQGGEPWNWFICHSPMTVALFLVFFTSALAEASRTPFDLPEAESELVSGYNTEYSGFRFAAYFLSEFANTWVASALAVACFLGGWQIPFVSDTSIASATGLPRLGWELLSGVIFVSKVLVLVVIIIQLRWTLPRVRLDQLMNLSWKYLVPITLVATLLLMLQMVFLPWQSTGALVIRLGMAAALTLGVAMYVRAVRAALVQSGDHAYRKWAL